MNLCQPDDKKSCSACCGLLNHSDISRKNLTHFLNEGNFRVANYWRYQIDGCYPEQTTTCRDKTSYICPFNGFIARGRPGCLIHPLYTGEEKRDMSLFGARVCDNFSCPAYSLFNDDAQKLIIENIQDWYLYTTAIIDPFSTLWIIEHIHRAGIKNNTPAFENALNASLIIHGRALSQYKNAIFCYSTIEYNLEGKNFSLNADNDRSRIEQKKVLRIIEDYKDIS